VPRSLDPDIGIALAAIHISQDDVPGLDAELRDSAQNLDSVGRMSNVHTGESCHNFPGSKGRHWLPGQLPSGEDLRVASKNPLPEGAAFKWTSVVVDDR
jgi:hypothetical protein